MVVVDTGKRVDGVEAVADEGRNGGLAVDISTVADFAFFLRADFDMTIPTQSSARYRPSHVRDSARRHTLVFVNVAEQQHAAKLAFVVAREAATRGERFGVAIGAEQPVP